MEKTCPGAMREPLIISVPRMRFWSRAASDSNGVEYSPTISVSPASGGAGASGGGVTLMGRGTVRCVAVVPVVPAVSRSAARVWVSILSTVPAGKYSGLASWALAGVPSMVQAPSVVVHSIPAPMAATTAL